jgi:hypothetical protein
MEWWIVAGLVLAVGVVGLASRIRKSRRSPGERDGERDGKTIYPLW